MSKIEWRVSLERIVDGVPDEQKWGMRFDNPLGSDRVAKAFNEVGSILGESVNRLNDPASYE